MTACHCKKCGIITKHRPAEEPARVRCEVCATERYYAKAFGAGDFPQLTFEENEVIHEARACGFGASFMAYPDADAQARRTLAAALRWLDREGPRR